MSTAFQTFTGAKAKEHPVKHEKSLFQFVQQSDEKNHLMAAACFNDFCGLVSCHAYSLLQVVVVDKFQLLLLRNPWAQYEWKGAWSDGDAMWDKHPDVKKKLRPEFRDDGLFWMCWADFC